MSLFQMIKDSISNKAESSPETETVRKIAGALDQLEEERAKFIATFAYLLCRVARADMNVSPEETQE